MTIRTATNCRPCEASSEKRMDEILHPREGDHLCLFYERDPVEQLPVLIPFIQQALPRDEQFIYIADDQTAQELSERLKDGGVDVARECARGRLKLWTRREWRQPGSLSSNERAAQIRRFMAGAAEEGFRGVRFAVEMTWTLGLDMRASELEHWEAILNTLFVPSFPGRIICQYNRSRLAPDVLLAALHTHPQAILENEICPNPFYRAPFILNGNGPAENAGDAEVARVDWMVSQLKKAREAEKAREELLRQQAAAERERIDAVLRSSEERLRQIMTLMPAAVYTCDREGRITFFNRRAAELWGREPKLGDDDQKFCGSLRLWFPDGTPMRHRETPMARALSDGGAARDGEVVVERPDGSRITVSVNIDRLYDEAGNCCGAVNVFQEVTERRRTEMAAQRLAAIVQSSDDAIVGKDLNGIVSSWNAGAERIFGYTASEMLGKSITTLIPADRRDEEPAILAGIARGERIHHYETVRQRKDGTLIDISLTISPIRDGAGTIIGASKIARDITERKRAQAELSRSEKLYRAIGESMDYGIWTCDGAGRNTYLSDSFLKLLGATQEQCAGFNWPDFLHPDEREETLAAWRRCVEQGNIWECEHRVRGADGQWHPILARGVPIRDEHGKIASWAGINLDISALKRTEQALREAKENLARANESLEARVEERTASLREAIAQMEEFSYSVSHDLRAPVRAMQGYATALVEDHGERLDDEAREYLHRIIRGGERMDRLIQDILTYSRLTRQEVQLQTVSLEKLVREILEQYPQLLSSGARIALVGELLSVRAHEASLTQAIANLLNNAVKFTAPGTKPRVRVRTERRGKEVRLWVEDNGIGIRPEHQHRLFGMFERIHPEQRYEGTGIGLAIVRKAVERMGGTVGVESDGLTGSNFWIDLAAAAE